MKPGTETALLATKLRAPAAPRVDIPRAAARRLLHEAGSRSLCVIASAGSGKSTVLRQMQDVLVARGQRCAWLNLDARDNDPASLLPYLQEALARLGAPGAETAQLPVELDTPARLRTAFDVLERLVAGLNGKVTLVLDDLHFVTAPALLTQLGYFLDACDGHLQVLIGARTLPDLQIPRRVLSGQFLALPDGFLRFTQAEAEAFFAGQGMATLAPDAVNALNRSTEGWVAGLQFAAISLRHRPEDQTRLIARLSGSEAQISAYLASTVFQDLPADWQHFLLKTAALGQFTAALCNHVTGREDAEQVLRGLQDANLFLIPLDPEGRWFRYHHLFADFLNARSRRQNPQDQRDIRLLAGQWCVANDLPDEAVTYFLQIDHHDEAARLIARVAIPETRDRGDHARVLRWLGALPERFRRHRPELILAQTLALGFSRGATQGKALLDGLRADLRPGLPPWNLTPDQVAAHRCYADVIELLLFAAEEKTDATIRDAEAWERRWPRASAVDSGIVRNVMAYSHMANNRFPQAAAMATEARLLGLQAGSPYVAIWADCLMALTHIAAGDPGAARRFIDRAWTAAGSDMADQTLLRLMIPLLDAQAAYEQGDMDIAFSRLTLGSGFAATFGPLEPLLIAYRLQAQRQRLAGDSLGALRVLERGQAIADQNGLPRLSVAMLAEQVTLLIETGARDQADRLCADWGLLDRSWLRRFGTDNPMQANTLKRIEIEMALAQGAPDAALLKCRSLARDLRGGGRPRLLIRLGLLKAAALHALGRDREARRELSVAVRLAQPNGLWSGFFELRGLCVPILTEIAAQRDTDRNAAGPLVDQPEAWLLQRLTGRSVDAPASPAQPEVPPLAEPLTPRELDMLRLAGLGCTNAQIAAELLVSVATVKWHLYNAFQKLGARNRVTALERSRALGLLPASG